MTQQTTIDDEMPAPTSPETLWQQNHGNLLLAFVGLVFALGAIILLYKQHQLSPPPLPDSELLSNPDAIDSEQFDMENSTAIWVTGAVNDQGLMRIAVYDSKDSFNNLEQAVLRLSTSIVEGEASLLIPTEQLPEKMAIAAFQDENNDGVLNLNRFGVPSERYGYSQNARAVTGPPKFDEAAIDRPPAGETIMLSIR